MTEERRVRFGEGSHTRLSGEGRCITVVHYHIVQRRAVVAQAQPGVFNLNAPRTPTTVILGRVPRTYPSAWAGVAKMGMSLPRGAPPSTHVAR